MKYKDMTHLDGSQNDHILDSRANSLGPSPDNFIHSNALRTMTDRNTTSKISLFLSSRRSLDQDTRHRRGHIDGCRVQADFEGCRRAHQTRQCVNHKPTHRAKLRPSWDSPPRLFLQSLFTPVETLSRSRVRRFPGSRGHRSPAKQPTHHGKGICAPNCKQSRDERRRKNTHLHRPVTMTDDYARGRWWMRVRG